MDSVEYSMPRYTTKHHPRRRSRRTYRHHKSGGKSGRNSRGGGRGVDYRLKSFSLGLEAPPQHRGGAVAALSAPPPTHPSHPIDAPPDSLSHLSLEGPKHRPFSPPDHPRIDTPPEPSLRTPPSLPVAHSRAAPVSEYSRLEKELVDKYQSGVADLSQKFHAELEALRNKHLPPI
jgi:hypothetical protein